MIPHVLLPNVRRKELPAALATLPGSEGGMLPWLMRGAFQQTPFAQIYGETLRVHPMTQALAYVARQGQHHVVVQNQQVGQPYDAVWFDSLRFTPNGEALFYLAERGGRTLFVVNGLTQREFGMVLEVKLLGPGDDSTACGLDVATARERRIGWHGIMPRVPEFRLGKG